MGPMSSTTAGPSRQRVAGRPVVLTQRWADIVWAHWRVDVAEVRGLVPPTLEVDTCDGSAWVGLVPFQMEDLRPVVAGRRLPGLGSTTSFAEVNVRTYVTGPEGPGVWFHTLDATSRLAVVVARGAWALPYRAARVTSVRTSTARGWDVERRDGTTGALAVSIGGGTATTALEDFLTARYRLYAPLGHRRLLTAPVRHPPWDLRAASVERLDPGLVTASGYHPAGAPDHVVAAEAVDVAIGLPQVLHL